MVASCDEIQEPHWLAVFASYLAIERSSCGGQRDNLALCLSMFALTALAGVFGLFWRLFNGGFSDRVNRDLPSGKMPLLTG